MKGCFGQRESILIFWSIMFVFISRAGENVCGECARTCVCDHNSLWSTLRTAARQKQPHLPCQRPNVPYWHLLCLPPSCCPTPPTELHLPALFNIRKDPASSVRYFKSHESSSVTYQTLNHVLGCRPSPPILLILPKPHSFCLQLRLRLKGA